MRTLAGVVLILGALILAVFGDPSFVTGVFLLCGGFVGLIVIVDDL